MDSLGQVIITGIEGKSITKDEAEFLSQEKVSGVVLTSQNFDSPAQLAELVNSIQKCRDEYPLFVCAGIERSENIFNKQFSQFPSLIELAKNNSPKLVFEIFEVIAKESHACGLNLLFSPSCDVLSPLGVSFLGENAFSADPLVVEKMISAAIRGLQTNGVLSCAKHFPGYGEATKDPQTGLPFVKVSKEEIISRHIIPFIKASKSRVEFMMMGHMQIDSIDSQFPTTLSPKAYELLRNSTKFSKIIITDQMDLKAITEKYSIQDSAIQAINSGADILLYRNMNSSRIAIDALKEAIKKRSIKKELFVEKMQRIEKCKKEHFSTYDPIYIPKITDAFNPNQSKAILDQFKINKSKA